MSHGCIARVNAMLAEHNTRLAEAFSFGDPKAELVILATTKADEKVRKRPKSMFASFCPFCGVRLLPEPCQFCKKTSCPSLVDLTLTCDGTPYPF